MHRNDKSKFLLYIEPPKEEKLRDPINDEITKLMELAFSKAKPGVANYSSVNEEEKFHEGGAYKGCHHTECGYRGGNQDYLLENGLITNSLCVFYLQRYRKSIPENDWMKIKSLADYYKIEIKLPEQFQPIKESYVKNFENWKDELEDVMVNELSKTIDKDIINKIKNKS